MPHGLLHPYDFPRPRTAVGVDLGQRQDPTAIAVIHSESIWLRTHDPVTWEPLARRQHALVYLERLPLDTPYAEVATRVERLVRRLAADQSKVIVAMDATGVGQPVVELVQGRRLPAIVRPVWLTGADRSHEAGDGSSTIPARDLLGKLALAFEGRKVVIPPKLPLLDALRAELAAVRSRPTTTGRTRVAAASGHDDLVFALALAWWASDVKL